EGVGATAAALVDLSTVAGNKISNPPWVKFQSAGWVNFPSAPTGKVFIEKLIQVFVLIGVHCVSCSQKKSSVKAKSMVIL
ncbi:hypothetical protein V8693_33130, partial [Pseudomonas aeruginosa]|uniref:hypothetical protein n=1 Tax=Pseudomonas aeruginosa TaxID=287 RepID=UPI0032184291